VKSNPVEEWLARVAKECGSPEQMVKATSLLDVSNVNSTKLIIAHANRWRVALDRRKPA
jgi:hypothetical protein